MYVVIVALRTSAWIETGFSGNKHNQYTVALRTSAWIETGLLAKSITAIKVALRTSAWIETPTTATVKKVSAGRAPHERVD